MNTAQTSLAPDSTGLRPPKGRCAIALPRASFAAARNSLGLRAGGFSAGGVKCAS